MRSDEILPYLTRIAVLKNITGSVQVQTHRGPVLITQPGLAYVLAEDREQVSLLLKSNSNIKTLLQQRQLSLVF